LALSKKHAVWIRTAVDYGSLLSFLGTILITHDFMKATVVLVVASVIALAIGLAVERRLAPLPLLTGAAALIFGTLTLVFHDKSFVKMKLTFVDGCLTVLLVGGLILKRYPLKSLLGASLALADEAWRTLSVRYAIFFGLSAVANEIVWRTQTDGRWAIFRLADFGAALIFSIAQTPYLMKHMVPPSEEAVALEPPDAGF
jgi:intracellular septation protein